MNLKKRQLLAALSALAMSVSAFAADDHKGHNHEQKKGTAHAHDTKPLHGGVVTIAKDIHYELVAKPESIVLYIADHGKPVDVKGVEASVLLLSANDKTEVKLAPSGENKLEAKGNFKITPGTKALVSVVMPGKPVAKVRFTLK